MGRRRTAVAAAALAAVVAALAVATTPASAPSPGLDYVALGDSYSAGPLIPRQRLEAGLCLRSDHNYPSLLAQRLHVTSFRDETCTGAKSSDLSRPVRTGLPGPPAAPQLAALGRGTDLVTLGIGGNDDGLFTTIFRTCPEVAHLDPTGAPCRDAFTDEQGHDELAARIGHVRAHLATLLGRIHARAPRATVWIVGYPRVLPADGTCRAIPFAAGDYRWADRLERTLNTTLEAAAALDDAHFLDTYAASTGHDACAGPEAWINGAVESLRRGAAYHPLRAGMEAEARMLAAQVEAGGAGGAGASEGATASG